jgi:PAS domain S-box-containing protein
MEDFSMARKLVYEELEQRINGLEKASIKLKRVKEKPRKNDDKQWTSNELFYKAFSMSPIPTSITAISDGNVLKVNEAFEQLTGYREYEIKDQSMVDLNIWDNPEDRTSIVNDLLEKGPIRNREITVRTKSGEIRVCYYSAEIIELNDKQYILSMAIDETERIRAEEALRESEARYREIASSIPGVVYQFLLKKDGSYSSPYISESASLILDISAEEIMEDAYSLFNMIFEEDLDPVNQSIAESAQTMERWLQEFRIRDKAGNIRWIRATSTPHQLPDGGLLWNGVLLDISDRVRAEKELKKAHNDLEIRIEERTAEHAKTNKDLQAKIIEHKRAEEALRESEEKYRTLLDEIDEGYFETDLTGKFTFVSDWFLRIAGDSREDLLKMTNRDYMTPESSKKVYKIFAELLQTGEPAKNVVHEIVTTKGEKRVHELSASLMRDRGGNPIGFRGTVRNVTERVKFENALRESEEKYRTILEDIEDAYYEDDLSGNFTFFNDSVCRILGYSKEELMGMNYRKYIDEETAEEVFQAYNKVYTTGKPIKGFEIEAIRKDSTKIYTESSASLMKDKESQPIGFRGIVRDVTERKQAEEALRESEEKYRRLFENTGTAIFIAEEGMTISHVNAMCEKLTGYSRDEIEGKMKTIDFVADEEVERIKAYHIGRRETDSNIPTEYELRLVDRQGSIKNVIIQIGMIPNTKQSIASIIDITPLKETEEALRESEERYRNFIDNAPIGMYTINTKGEFTYANKKLLEMTGYKLEDSLNKSFHPIVHPEDLPMVQEKIQKRIDGKGTTAPYEIKIFDASGRIMWVKIQSESIYETDENGNNRIREMQSFVEDITEQMFFEEEKKRLQEQLQQVQKMEAIGILAGGIAHDFNNILSPIMVHSEMGMMKVPPDNPVHQHFDEIFKAGERATDMVKQILTFSRKEEGKRAALKIIPIIKEVLKMLRSTIPTTIDIQQNLEAESDTVLADPTQIHQIIVNLGTNAAHAMRGRGGTLNVSLAQEELDSETAAQYSDLNPGSYLKLTMSDTGCGMNEETMQKIFDPYFTTKEPGEGTGMGLAVVHGIVKSYGGDITVESEPGKGTTFHVLLARVETKISPIKKRKIELPSGTERLLFVDDEKGVIDSIQPMLEILGYKVTARTSSIEALQAFRHKAYEFDLVITDMTMPNMTGKELARKMMSIRSDIPVILCTGFSEQIDEDRAKEMGISAFVMKPIIMHEIASTIRQVLEKKQ